MHFWNPVHAGNAFIILIDIISNMVHGIPLRTGIRTFEPQIQQKNKNIEAQQNLTGSYKKKRVYCIS